MQTIGQIVPCWVYLPKLNQCDPTFSLVMCVYVSTHVHTDIPIY